MGLMSMKVFIVGLYTQAFVALSLAALLSSTKIMSVKSLSEEVGVDQEPVLFTVFSELKLDDISVFNIAA